MIKGLTYKKKCQLLYGSLAFVLVMVCKISVSDTISLAAEVREKEVKLKWLQDKESELPGLKAKMAEFDKACFGRDSIAVRRKLTSFISAFAEDNGCLVTEIPVAFSYKNDQLKVQTNTFTICGRFIKLLSLLYKLEDEYRYHTKIVSSRFYSTYDLHKKRKNLYLTIIAQSVERKSN